MEAHNFKTAQRIDKQIADFSSTINALKDGNRLAGITPWSFDAT